MKPTLYIDLEGEDGNILMEIIRKYFIIHIFSAIGIIVGIS